MATEITVNGNTYNSDASFAGYTYVVALLNLVADIMADAGRGLVTTSFSSYTLGSGSGTVTMSAAIPYTAGTFVLLADRAAPTTNYALLQVTSVSGTDLTFMEVIVVGSGTKAAWNLSNSGPRGPAGADGALAGSATGDIDMDGYALTVDHVTSEAAGEVAAATATNLSGTVTLVPTGKAIIPYTLTGDATLLVAGAETIGDEWQPEIRTTQDGTGGWNVTILPANMLLNTDTLATQSVTVTAVAHTLSFYGTGTITLSGASTAGPLVGTGASDRVSLTFTPSAGSLTLTVSGSVTQAQLVLGSSQLGYGEVGASRSGMIQWRSGASSAIDFAGQAATTESRFILNFEGGGIVTVDDVSVVA